MKVDKELCRFILTNATNFPSWTVQGFGMLRLALDEDHRLQVWNTSLRTPNVSDIHDHPWDFESIILAGTLFNERFTLAPAKEIGDRYNATLLIPGPNGGKIGNPWIAWLKPKEEETYLTGEAYAQRAGEIHRTGFLNGTVTLIHRVPVPPELDKANVFWREGEWVDAKPRSATPEQVIRVTQDSLRRWFK